jgi:ribosomal protein L11 methyltransferase
MLVWRKISSEKWSDSWVERLAFLGTERLVITRFANSRRVRLEIFDIATSEANLLKKNFGGEIRNLARSSADWVRSVVLKKPISIRGRIFVRNSEQENPKLDLGKDLYIPAGLAFGTGDHATTATCLRMLCDIAPRNVEWSLLDIGTGTGVLALAGARLGAKPIEAFDFDPVAIRTAKQNAKLNQITGIKFFKQDVLTFEPKDQFNVVTANLYSEIFKRAADRVWATVTPGGWLLTSGIMRDQFEAIEILIRKLGAKNITSRFKGKWATILSMKKY